MSPTVGKRRTVIVAHPDFDKTGADGILDAKNFAQTMIDGQRQMIELAKKSGEPAAKILEVEKYVKAFTIVIRSIDDEII